jgi:predicted nucleic-acid-binding protein
MTITLDTSCLARFFLKDDLDKLEQVKELLSSTKYSLRVPDATFIELDHLLIKMYRADKEDVIESLRFIVTCPTTFCSDYILTAVELYAKKPSLSLADCMIAVESRDGKLASFDKKLLSQGEVKKYW